MAQQPRAPADCRGGFLPPHLSPRAGDPSRAGASSAGAPRPRSFDERRRLSHHWSVLIFGFVNRVSILLRKELLESPGGGYVSLPVTVQQRVQPGCPLESLGSPLSDWGSPPEILI